MPHKSQPSTPGAAPAQQKGEERRGSQIVGLIGHPLGHSRSPIMQQAAFDALGLPVRYDLWDTLPANLPARIESLRAPEALGANVTIPHKLNVIPLLDSFGSTVRSLAGAVNTIVREETTSGVRLVGHNTDATALLRILDAEDVWRPDLNVLVLGAGGVAQAALGVILLRGGLPWVAARKRSSAREALETAYARLRANTPIQPESLATISRPGASASGQRPIFPPRPMPDRVKPYSLPIGDLDALAQVLPQTRLLINCTPVGTRDPQASPIPLDLLRRLPRDAFILDLVYNPPETALVRAAHAGGLRASGGLTMLLYQGAASFTLWTGQEAPLAVMRRALESALEADSRA